MNDKIKLVELLLEYGLIGGVSGAIKLANWLVKRGVIVQSDDEGVFGDEHSNEKDM